MLIYCKLLDYKFINFCFDSLLKTYFISKLIKYIFYNNIAFY